MKEIVGVIKIENLEERNMVSIPTYISIGETPKINDSGQSGHGRVHIYIQIT